MGSDISKGLQKRSDLKSFVKSTSAQAKSLAEFLPDESPFKKMAQGAVDFFNDPENRFSEHLAMAKSLEPNLKMVQMDLSAGLADKAMKMQKAQVDLAASQRLGQSMGLTDLVASEADRDKLARLSPKTLRELQENPDAIAAYKTTAMQGLLSIEAARKKGGAITTLQQPFVDPKTKKVHIRSAFQQDGQIISPWTVVPKDGAGKIGPAGRELTEAEVIFNAEATKDLVPWASGGADLAQNEVDKLDVVLKAFDDGVIKTGPLQGSIIPDVIRAKTVEQREKVQSIIAKSIKELFGGNPSLEEVKRLFQFAWNDQLPEAANRKKVVALQKDLNDRIRKKNEQLKELTETGFVLPRGDRPPVSEAEEPVKPTREVTEGDASTLRAIQAAEGGGQPADTVQPPAQPPASLTPEGVDLYEKNRKEAELPVQPRVNPEEIERVLPPDPLGQPGETGSTGPVPEFASWTEYADHRKSLPRDSLPPVNEEIRVDGKFWNYSPEEGWKELTADFMVLTTPRDHAASRVNLKNVKHVISTDFNSGGRGDPTPSPGIEAVVPKNAPAGAVAKVKEYLKETETWLRSKGVDTSIRRSGKNEDGILYTGGSSRFYYTEPFFKTDAASRKAIEKDPDGYARILARTLGSLPGVAFIPPHQVGKRTGAVIPGTKISEQEWALKHVIPALNRITKR
tara:strand:+ start:16408 stop:18453 length:2046 start_codon:yes stop_codon:yes gene_type:complete